MNQQLILSQRQAEIALVCKNAHRGQQRKYTGEPVFFHHMEVAHLSQNVPFGIEIGFLHDILEDTSTTPAELSTALQIAGYSYVAVEIIMDGVIALTDVYTAKRYPSLNREKRQAKETQRLKRINPFFQTIKYADIISNAQSIAMYDKKFATVWLPEKISLLTHMTNGDAALHAQAQKLVLHLYKNLHNERVIAEC